MISFIIPLFNHLAETQAMLVSLNESLPPELDYEVILVDDYSTDGTRDWLANLKQPSIITILNPQNYGYAKSNNIGVQAASGHIIALLNNDLLFQSGWLQPMQTILTTSYLNAGVVGNVQFRVIDGTLDHAGIYLDANAQFQHINRLPESAIGFIKTIAVTGACMLLFKKDFEAVGGFDERYVNGCEDVDLCLKLGAANKNSYVATASRIYHHVSLSRESNALNNIRNSHYLFSRWRKVIKQALSAVWRDLLAQEPAAYVDYLDGNLMPAFLETPYAASLIIAETMILREEYRWLRDLDKPNTTREIINGCFATGISYEQNNNYYILNNYSEFCIENLCSARNFYICGYSSVDFDTHPVSITISINNIQEKAFYLTSGRNINIGILNPILLPNKSNHFTASIYRINIKNQPINNTIPRLVISHIVVDDQVVSSFVSLLGR